MKKNSCWLALVLLMVAALFLMGCDEEQPLPEVTEQEVIEDPIEDPVEETTAEETVVDDPVVEGTEAEDLVGTGSGEAGDPYIVELGQVYAGNLPDYGMVSSVVTFRVMAEPGQNYTGTLTISDSDRHEEPFWITVNADDGEERIADGRATDVFEMIGEEVLSVTAATDKDYINFVLTTNVTSDDVFFEFVIDED